MRAVFDCCASAGHTASAATVQSRMPSLYPKDGELLLRVKRRVRLLLHMDRLVLLRMPHHVVGDVAARVTVSRRIVVPLEVLVRNHDVPDPVFLDEPVEQLR